MSHPDSHGDSAIANRLARLGAMPVDTGALDRAITAMIPPQAPRSRGWRRPWVAWSGVAAAVLLIAAVSLSMFNGRPAMASPALMAQIHQDLVEGRVPTMHADSIDDANRAIAAMAGNFPSLPQAPAAHGMACCMRNVGSKKMACVLLNDGATPVSMMVAAASDVDSPKSPAVTRGGIAYHIQSVGDLYMVMTQRDNRWICLVGKLSAEELMDLASQVKF